MAWDFLFLVRRLYRSSDDWGKLFIRTRSNEWEFLSYTYELPWQEDTRGNSLAKKSRIKEGTYQLIVRSNGPKGWRLELLETGHRRNIQVHRAHSSMYIEGCILPVYFEDFIDPGHPKETIKKGQAKIQKRSVELMKKIEERYEDLKEGKSDRPTIVISALLPSKLLTPSNYAYA